MLRSKSLLTSTLSKRKVSREVEVYEHLSKLARSHAGGPYIRGLYDTFGISVPCGIHRCLVHPPMHMSINALRMRDRSGTFSGPLLKQTLICLSQALVCDCLHSEANIVHSGPHMFRLLTFINAWWSVNGVADIKASNIMLSIDDETNLTELEKKEEQHPSPRKTLNGNRTIYASREAFLIGSRFMGPTGTMWSRGG